MGLLSEIGSWASEKVINGNIYYHVVRSKIIKELPLFYGKSDAIYMDFKTLLDKGLIEYIKDENRDYVRFSEIGKMWNEYIPVK